VTDDLDEIPKAVLDGLMDHGIPVKAAREAAGMDIADLHFSTGIDVDRLEAFETGAATPTGVEAGRIATATGIPAAIFIE
jgi:ribosome-binding protein aMBF1 (putative translation factor)